MNTNSRNCELCKESTDKEYFLDDIFCCESCFEKGKENTDFDVVGELQENFCN